MSASFGNHLWISRAVDERPVRANRIRKSVGAENIFATDLTELEPMIVELVHLIDKVWRYCASGETRGRTVTLKVKFDDFEIITRSRSLLSPIASRDELAAVAVGLLEENMPLPRPVRLLGVSLSTLQIGESAKPQLDLGL
jgi:DNA polymerase-4